MIRKLFTPIGLAVAMTIITVILSIILFVSLVMTVVKEPSADPTSIKVLRRDGLTQVPKEITVGKPFTYHVKGEKFVDNGANLRIQINCQVNGVETISTVGEFYSKAPKGTFDLHRNFIIPNSQKLVPSDDCFLQFIATYTFYQIDRFGEERSIDIPDEGRSTKFKLIVPETIEDEKTQSNTTSSVEATTQQLASNGTPRQSPSTSNPPDPAHMSGSATSRSAEQEAMTTADQVTEDDGTLPPPPPTDIFVSLIDSAQAMVSKLLPQ